MSATRRPHYGSRQNLTCPFCSSKTARPDWPAVEWTCRHCHETGPLRKGSGPRGRYSGHWYAARSNGPVVAAPARECPIRRSLRAQWGGSRVGWSNNGRLSAPAEVGRLDVAA